MAKAKKIINKVVTYEHPPFPRMTEFDPDACTVPARQERPALPQEERARRAIEAGVAPKDVVLRTGITPAGLYRILGWDPAKEPAVFADLVEFYRHRNMT